MPITLEEIVAEAGQWPPEQIGELVGRLTEKLHDQDPGAEAAWNEVIDRRLQEIQTGRVQGIPAAEVFAEVEKLLGR